MKLAKHCAIEIIKHNGGIIRTHEALKSGIHRRTFYGLWDEGIIIQLSRGLFQLASLDRPANFRLAEVSKKVPHGIVCLKSALAFHKLTVPEPDRVWLAVERKARKPKIDAPPLHTFFFSGEMFSRGVQTHFIMNQPVHIYSAPKTIIDCFRWQKTVGLDYAVRAARAYLKQNDTDSAELMFYAKICRIESRVRAYLQILKL
jgi:predicted transcriptional regulator of viral defense system